MGFVLAVGAVSALHFSGTFYKSSQISLGDPSGSCPTHPCLHYKLLGTLILGLKSMGGGVKLHLSRKQLESRSWGGSQLLSIPITPVSPSVLTLFLSQ